MNDEASPSHLLVDHQRCDQGEHTGEDEVETDEPHDGGGDCACPEDEHEAETDVDDATEQQEAPRGTLTVGGDGFGGLGETTHEEQHAEDDPDDVFRAFRPEQEKQSGQQADEPDAVGGDARSAQQIDGGTVLGGHGPSFFRRTSI